MQTLLAIFGLDCLPQTKEAEAVRGALGGSLVGDGGQRVRVFQVIASTP